MKRFDVGCVHVHVRGGGGVVPHCIPGWRRKRGACVMLMMTRMIRKMTMIYAETKTKATAMMKSRMEEQGAPARAEWA